MNEPKFVGMAHELEILGQLWAPKDDSVGGGAFFLPEFGTKLDVKKVKKAMLGIIASFEEKKDE